jgi:dTDP-4-amino-4,6-dideoxygalactose transaminase
MNIQAITVTRDTTLFDALALLDKHATGILLLYRPDGKFEQTVTDGDIRRLLLKGSSLQDKLHALPSIVPVTVLDGVTREAALNIMNEHVINHLPVLGPDGAVTQVLERKEIDEQILLSTPHLGSWEREYVDEAFRTNWIAPLGPNVDAFEAEVAAHVGISHAAALSSGTAAIHLALRILGVTRGDVVFCSTLTFAASANPIVYEGAQPVFVDSEPESWNMSPVALEKAFDWAKREGRMPKAVIVVSLYGQSADMDPIIDICARHGVPIIEDAAESLGAKYKGKSSGTFGLMGVYSFNGNKIITTSGGGMLISEDESLIKKARFLATQARDPAPHYEHSQIGFNYRMSNILAGVGRGQLQVLEERVRSRRAVFSQYREGLKSLDFLEWMPEPPWSYSTHWLSACTVDASRSPLSASQMIKRLAEEKIEARPVWKPMHLQPVFAGCPSFDHGDSSFAAAVFNNGICLPSGSNLSVAQLERVIGCIGSLLAGQRQGREAQPVR